MFNDRVAPARAKLQSFGASFFGGGVVVGIKGFHFQLRELLQRRHVVVFLTTVYRG